MSFFLIYMSNLLISDKKLIFFQEVDALAQAPAPQDSTLLRDAGGVPNGAKKNKKSKQMERLKSPKCSSICLPEPYMHNGRSMKASKSSLMRTEASKIMALGPLKIVAANSAKLTSYR